MALNLWNHSIMYDSEEDLKNGHISSAYAPSEIFCCSYAPYFWEAIKIRYPEYTRYNTENKYNTLFDYQDKENQTETEEETI